MLATKHWWIMVNLYLFMLCINKILLKYSNIAYTKSPVSLINLFCIVQLVPLLSDHYKYWGMGCVREQYDI